MPNEATSSPDALMLMTLDTDPVGAPFCTVDDVADGAA
jgi:hypothetical protein